jgi:outer membrane protein OmpA-like peptidoglycan-associated protein
VLVSGAFSASGTTDADGEARIADLPTGEYQARVEAEGHLTRGARFSVAKRATASLQVALVARPGKPGVTVSGTTVTAKALKFAPGTTVLAPGGSIVLAELADYLIRNPGSGRLRIQCDGDEGLALTRALVIKQGLLDLGVAETQIDAVAEPAKTTSLTLVP